MGEVRVYPPCSLVSLGSALPGVALMDTRAPVLLAEQLARRVIWRLLSEH